MINLVKIGTSILEGGQIEQSTAIELLKTQGSDLFEVLAWSNRIREKFKGNKIHLCSIVNAKSGGCTENCSFCAQSVHSSTGIETYKFLERDEVMSAGIEAKQNGAQALGLVAAWRGLKDGKMLDQVCNRISELSDSGTIRVDASLGLIESKTVAKELKNAGLSVYNHNLETARSFFGKICTTHSYEDRLRTIKNCKSAGLKICSGGIFGMGETLAQRVELAFELRTLDVDFIPLNFLVKIDGTPLTTVEPIEPLEILKVIAMFRFVLPTANIMVAGGREANLRDLQSMIFMAGANATMVGNYLTTNGRSVENDLKMLTDLGLQWDYEQSWEK